ncbi:adenylate/guanylate cyclase domain-containing protein [Sanguibacter sp. A247]|uniref:adenylate/guanylate cyclase domain-containing protein n=1 Tax=unclassified Sanguibacter TaxID=2645534 RepID=UPI003FD8CEB1
MSDEWSQEVERVVARLLGGERSTTLHELAEESGVDDAWVARYWQLMGLPGSNPEAREYTHRDVEALADLHAVADQENFDARTFASLVRSVGHSTERLSWWHFEALVDHTVRQQGLLDPDARRAVIRAMDRLAPVLERQLVHAWRRQTAALVTRMAAEFGDADQDAASIRSGRDLPLPRAVGFADIVSFTRMTATMSPEDFSNFIQAFEARARDIVTANGGRVVKTIGDALLFIADDVVTGARVALGLAKATEDDLGVEGIAGRPVRVSLVWGRVLARFGDVFGPSVNLASRLTDQAQPSTVLLDEVTAHRLASNPHFALTNLEPREVPGLGTLTPVRLDFARD